MVDDAGVRILSPCMTAAAAAGMEALLDDDDDDPVAPSMAKGMGVALKPGWREPLPFPDMAVRFSLTGT